jgi:hypothetical protein
MPEVGLPIHVIDGSGDVEPFRHPGATVKHGPGKCNPRRERVRGRVAMRIERVKKSYFNELREKC